VVAIVTVTIPLAPVCFGAKAVTSLEESTVKRAVDVPKRTERTPVR
jgi:hypothetical protein